MLDKSEELSGYPRKYTIQISLGFISMEKMILISNLVIVPYYNSETDARQIGGAFWLSEKVYDTNFARLYIYGENDTNFKLVYSDSVPLGYYQGQLIGPIKIWEVNYPSHIKADPKYMEESRYG